MSALDKLLGRKPAEEIAEGIEPIKVGLFGGPMGKIFASIMPPEVLEKTSADIEAFLNYIREQFALILRQNVLVIDQQKLIITQNEEILSLLKGKEDAAQAVESLAAGDEVAGGTGEQPGNSGQRNNGNRGRSRSRKPAESGSGNVE